MARSRKEYEAAKKALCVYTDTEVDKILNHGATVEDYPSSCTIIEKIIVEEKDGNTTVQSLRARGRRYR